MAIKFQLQGFHLFWTSLWLILLKLMERFDPRNFWGPQQGSKQLGRFQRLCAVGSHVTQHTRCKINFLDSDRPIYCILKINSAQYNICAIQCLIGLSPWQFHQLPGYVLRNHLLEIDHIGKRRHDTASRLFSNYVYTSTCADEPQDDQSTRNPQISTTPLHCIAISNLANSDA